VVVVAVAVVLAVTVYVVAVEVVIVAAAVAAAAAAAAAVVTAATVVVALPGTCQGCDHKGCVRRPEYPFPNIPLLVPSLQATFFAIFAADASPKLQQAGTCLAESILFVTFPSSYIYIYVCMYTYIYIYIYIYI